VERAAQLFQEVTDTVLAPQEPQPVNRFVASPLALASGLAGVLQRVWVRGCTHLKRFVELYL